MPVSPSAASNPPTRVGGGGESRSSGPEGEASSLVNSWHILLQFLLRPFLFQKIPRICPQSRPFDELNLAEAELPSLSLSPVVETTKKRFISVSVPCGVDWWDLYERIKELVDGEDTFLVAIGIDRSPQLEVSHS